MKSQVLPIFITMEVNIGCLFIWSTGMTFVYLRLKSGEEIKKEDKNEKNK